MRVLALLPLLALASCKLNVTEDGLPPAQFYAGSTNLIGVEMAFGEHHIGLGASYRFVKDHTKPAPPVVEWEPPYVYPIDDK